MNQSHNQYLNNELVEKKELKYLIEYVLQYHNYLYNSI